MVNESKTQMKNKCLWHFACIKWTISTLYCRIGVGIYTCYNPTLKYFIKIYLAFQKHEKTVMQYNPWLVLYTFFLFIFFFWHPDITVLGFQRIRFWLFLGAANTGHLNALTKSSTKLISRMYRNSSFLFHLEVLAKPKTWPKHCQDTW